MSTQIAVRLPDEVVAFLDKAVPDSKATSRAALVSAAVEREMRRQAAETDAAILGEVGAADDLDSLVNWTTRRPRDSVARSWSGRGTDSMRHCDLAEPLDGPCVSLCVPNSVHKVTRCSRRRAWPQTSRPTCDHFGP